MQLVSQAVLGQFSGAMSDKAVRFSCIVFSLTLAGEFDGGFAASRWNPQSLPGQEAISSGKDKENAKIVAAVHRLVNEFRQEQGLKPLTLDPIISAEASEHSAAMARNGGSISHRGFKQRLEDIRKRIPYRAAAENVALNVGYGNPERAAVEGWKNSPEHRKNMLGEFSLTGIGIAQSRGGGYFFTQIFVEPLK
jgi:uncharacterized protein YkwD